MTFIHAVFLWWPVLSWWSAAFLPACLNACLTPKIIININQIKTLQANPALMWRHVYCPCSFQLSEGLSAARAQAVLQHTLRENSGERGHYRKNVRRTVREKRETNTSPPIAASLQPPRLLFVDIFTGQFCFFSYSTFCVSVFFLTRELTFWHSYSNNYLLWR